MNGAAWGGSEELWYKMALYCSSKGVKTGVVCFNWPQKNEQLQQLEKSGCTVYGLSHKKGAFQKIKIGWQLRSIPFEQYDFVAVNQGGWKDIAEKPFRHLYKRLSNYIILFHNYDKGAALSAVKKNSLQQWMQKATLNVGASTAIFTTIATEMGINTANTAVWPNPITFKVPAAATAYPSVEEPVQWVLLTALDTKRKAQHILINTLAAATWQQRNWQLHIYGSGPDHAMLQELITSNGLTDKVFLQGHTSNVQQVLQNCHWLFQCTYKDAMPISVVEAMAMGRPCLVSAVGDMPAWITEGENGFVCNEVTTVQLDEQLEKIWQHKNQWPVMGANAYTNFLNKYPQNYEAAIFLRLQQLAG